MSLYEQINKDRMTAMKERNTLHKNILTVFLGDLQSDEKRGITITDAYIVQRLKKAIDNAQEMLDVTNNEAYTEEINLLVQYLPSQLNEDELHDIVEDYLNSHNVKNLGEVMAYLKANYAGKYDGKEASNVVRNCIAAK